MVEGAEPNAAHSALSDLENMGLVTGIITQNIDGLHQRAGSQEVVEFHGSSQRFLCQDCDKIFSPEEVKAMEFPPQCNGHYLKPDVGSL